MTRVRISLATSGRGPSIERDFEIAEANQQHKQTISPRSAVRTEGIEQVRLDALEIDVGVVRANCPFWREQDSGESHGLVALGRNPACVQGRR